MSQLEKDTSAPRPPTGWVAEGRIRAGKLLQSVLPGLATIFAIAAGCLIFEFFPIAGTAEARPVISSAIRIAGIAAIALAAISFLIATARRARGIIEKHIHAGEMTLVQSQTILATIRESVLVIDEHHRIQSANPATEALFGIPAARLISQPVTTLIPDRAIFQEKLDRPQTILTTAHRTGMPQFSAEVTLNEMTLDRRRHFLAIVRDVSDRDRSAETIRKISQGVVPAVGNDGTRVILRELAQVLGANRAFLVEIVGDGGSMVAMRTLSEHGELRGTSACDLRNTACAEILAKGYRLISAGARQQFPEDELLDECQGDAFAGMPLVDHRGRVLGAIGVLHDRQLRGEQIAESVLRIFSARCVAEIERKRFDEALGAEKERLAVTLRSIGDACVTMDNDGRIVMFNAVAERLTGWVHEDAAGQLLGEVLHLVDERTRRRAQHLIQRIVTTGTSDGANALNILISRDGEEHTVESSSAPIRDRLGRKLGSIVVLRDVTERQRAEEERLKAEKLESLGLVAGGIAHDFNNVLTGILGNVTLALGSKELPAPVTEYLSAARKASQRAQELAGQLLTFSKGGAPIKQATNLGQLLTDTVHCAIAGTRATCDTQIPADLWHVEVDPGQLAQVIANITVNAEQAMPGGGSILVTAENLDLPYDSVSLGLHAGRWVRFSVEDHGVGIPEQYLKKIFDPYFTTKPTGTGLGLAAAYSIVKNHGGVLNVESTPTVGSIFTIYLPATELALVPAEADAEPKEVPIGAGRVLILDDEEVICMLVTCALEPLGYEVTETQDGEVALEKYAEAMRAGRKFDLVISDLTMPGRMSGQEAIRRLRELDPNVRAIVSSGYANDPVMSRYQEFGFCGMIAKPYEIDALGRKVAEVMAAAPVPHVIFHDFESRKTA